MVRLAAQGPGASARLLRISISNNAAGILLSTLLPRISGEKARMPSSRPFASKATDQVGDGMMPPVRDVRG